jgi:nitrogen-specific signal transduction histidine kinase
VVTDITEQRRLEEELRQAQKMEAVGQLAGGVAHDFNNLLTVINGYNQLLMTSLPEGGRPRNYAQEVMQAAQRASSLTKQLLAFSRRQVTQPKLVDISVIVQNMTKMLRRLINEDIDLVTTLPPLRYKVLADPSQIEQIVLNLAVNARDAMPNGGKLTISTTEVVLDEHYTRTHLEAQPGPHVQISVSDTGHGMDAEIKRRVFEPFFTTKALGKGTGLGLSTVYGIVKQAGGNIWLYSEPGIGSTFKVYLPAQTADAHPEAFVPASSNFRGIETVLVVEDEDGLRKLVVELLQQLGYRVLAAADGEEALKACTSHDGFIHLLLTDVVMPRANGKEIAKYLSKLRPAMRVLFMSGYPDETILHHGVLAPGVAFLQKPFTQEALGMKVREVLDSPIRELEEV